MTVNCPICKGEGVCLHGNGVDPQKANEPKTCWMCKGTGKVEEVPTEKMHIKKYWMIKNSV